MKAIVKNIPLNTWHDCVETKGDPRPFGFSFTENLDRLVGKIVDVGPHSDYKDVYINGWWFHKDWLEFSIFLTIHDELEKHKY